jgi:hypothetical protein
VLVRAGAGTTAARTRALLVGPLRARLVARVGLGALGGLVLPGIAVAALSTDEAAVGGWPGALFAVSAVVVTAAELLERRLFFLASVTPRMPGTAR